MMPETYTHATALLALLDAASVDLINPDEVGVVLGQLIAERHNDDRLVVASYLALITSITDNAVGQVKVAAIEADHQAEQVLDADDKPACDHYRNHKKATRSLIALSVATRNAAAVAIRHTDDASHA